jgi:phage tail sheath gpL-like
MAGFPLTGVDPNDPIPGTIREIRFLQGAAVGNGAARDVVLVGNCTSGSTSLDNAGNPLNTLYGPLIDQTDAINVFGYRSELLLMYRAYSEIDPNANIYAVVVPEGTSAVAAAATITFASGPANAVSTVRVSCIGEDIEVAVLQGDTVTTIAANVAAAINNQLFWPVSAAAVAGVVTVTCANKGPRGALVVNRLRAAFTSSAGTTVAVAVTVVGAVDDDVTAALAALDTADIYYHVSAKHTVGDGSTTGQGPNTVVSSTDAGVGQYAAYIASIAQPSIGKEASVFFGLVGTAAQATTVASSVNQVRAQFAHAKTSDWTPAMLAAQYAAVVRSKQIAHPGANLTGYGQGDGDTFHVPDPYLKTNRLTATEIRLDLNNGVTPIGHTQRGQAFIVRQITSRCLTGNSYDYRAREGHTVSCADYFWSVIKQSYETQKLPFVADDPVKGQKPFEQTSTPSQLRAIIVNEMDRAILFTGGPFLDPSHIADMKASVSVVRLTDGLSARFAIYAVKHNNKGQFLELESSEAY